eukprot:Skav207562  [mRNA]  locus=scaffold3235:188071:190217:- [translate_table: standard]
MRMLRVFHIEVLQGSAAFVDQNSVELTKPDGTSSTLRSTAVVIATGSRANRLPQIDFELPGVFDSEPWWQWQANRNADTINQLDFIPKSMVVQGGGIIGLEYANMFAKLGAKVVVIEFMENILQMLDVDLKAALLNDLHSNKVEIMLKTGISSVLLGEELLSTRVQLLTALEGGVRGKPLLRVETTNGGAAQAEWNEFVNPGVLRDHKLSGEIS